MNADAIEAFCAHAAGLRFEAIPQSAVAATTRFLLDSFGVAVAGSSGPFIEALIASQAGASSGGSGARVLGRRLRLSPAGAALCNAYQTHNAEYDCVHEAAVVHPMAVILGAVLAHADRASQSGQPVTGRAAITAVTAGVDVAAGLGVASRAGLRFFRPATAGAFGAAAAVGRLLGLDTTTLRHACGLVLAQLSGTMQAHTEGLSALAMQVGFNARNALVACDLAAAGVPGPAGVLEGPFGYFELFEGAHELAPVLDSLGALWRITEVAHKPFPCGRATHGIIDAVLRIRATHGVQPAGLQSLVARVPPLTQRLIGRPPRPDMAVNYARLCGAYVAAVALRRGTVGLEDFTSSALRDPETERVAQRVTVTVDQNSDPNALTPVAVSATLADGRQVTEAVNVVYGNPALPMTRAAYLDKFRSNWRAAAQPLDGSACEESIRRLEAVQDEPDLAILSALAQPA